MRVGMGYDVHKLTEGRKLILGGVEIPYEKGLLGHSDADVLLHAIMDALLGAASLGDIGKHFPDTDPAYKGISSIKLLEHVELWKPLLTQFSLSEAYRNGLDKGIRWDIFSPPASPLNTRTISPASQQNLCNPPKM